MDFIQLFFGAVLGYTFQVAHEFIGQLRAPRGLFCTWQSSWQPTSVPESKWVSEELKIKRTVFGIQLININNSDGYEWIGKAKLINNKHLIGEWKSTKHGATAEGVFSLVFHIDGSFLTGFFQGPDLGQGKITSRFVLGRTKEDMKKALKYVQLNP